MITIHFLWGTEKEKNKMLREQDKKLLQYVEILVLSFCAALAFSMHFALPDLSEERQITPIIEIIWNLRYSLRNTSVTSSILFCVFMGIGIFNIRIKEYNTKALLFVSFIISIVWLMGVGFNFDNTLSSLTASTGQVVKSICYVAGMTYFLYQLGQLLLWWLKNGKIAENQKCFKELLLVKKYHTSPFLISFLAVVVCWLPYIVASYPGYICADALTEFAQFFGLQNFTSIYTPVHTLYIGFFVQLGLYLGSANIGLFLLVVFQAVVAALILAYMFFSMERIKTPMWLQIISFSIVVMAPHFTNSVEVVLKDNIYSYMFLLFIIEIIYVLKYGESVCFMQWSHRILFTISAVGVILFRNNGRYVLYPTIVIFFVYFCIRVYRNNRDKKNHYKIGAVFIFPILLAAIISVTVDAVCQVEDGGGDIQYMLSLPFQQTARYVAERGNEITLEEEKAISAILDYDNLAEIYVPHRSAAVISTYNETAIKGELIRYFEVWGKQFLKHPEIYIKATLNQNYFLIYPFTENTAIYGPKVLDEEHDVGKEVNKIMGIHEVDGTKNSRYAVNGIYYLMSSLPIVGLLSNPAVYNLILILLFVQACHKRMWKWILLSIPLVLSNVVVFLAPLVHARYMFPILYAMPIMVAYYINLTRE